VKYDEEGGRWVTTEDDHKIHIDKDGKIDKGNPHVIKAIKDSDEKRDSKAKDDFDSESPAAGNANRPVPDKAPEKKPEPSPIIIGKGKFVIGPSQKHHISGNTYPVKEKLKDIGCTWDGQSKSWIAHGPIMKEKADAIMGKAPPKPQLNSGSQKEPDTVPPGHLKVSRMSDSKFPHKLGDIVITHDGKRGKVVASGSHRIDEDTLTDNHMDERKPWRHWAVLEPMPYSDEEIAENNKRSLIDRLEKKIGYLLREPDDFRDIDRNKAEAAELRKRVNEIKAEKEYVPPGSGDGKADKGNPEVVKDANKDESGTSKTDSDLQSRIASIPNNSLSYEESLNLYKSVPDELHNGREKKNFAAALNSYTSASGDGANDIAKEQTAAMNEFLDKQKDLDSSVPIYRGLSFPNSDNKGDGIGARDKFIANLKATLDSGKSFDVKENFCSFSTDKIVASGFSRSSDGGGGCLLICKGTKGIKQIGAMSLCPDQSEVLARKGAKFKIEKIELGTYTKGKGYSVPTIYLTQGS
jgi:hypothetical protein